MSGYVYFIADDVSGRVKIGYSANPRARISQLQSATSHTLRLAALFRGSKDDEAAEQRRFIDARDRGEWFHLTDEIAQRIRELSSDYEVVAPSYKPELDEWTERACEWVRYIEDRYAARRGMRIVDVRADLANGLGINPGTMECLRRKAIKAITCRDYAILRVAAVVEKEAETDEIRARLRDVQKLTMDSLPDPLAELRPMHAALGLTDGAAS